MDTPSSEQKSPGKEAAENIARLHGTKPEIITVKMIGTEAVEDFIRTVQGAQANAHKGPPLQIRAAA